VRPGPFRYFKPDTLEQALEAVHNGAIPLAGGQSLIQAMRLRSAEPEAIVDLNSVADLSNKIECSTDFITIGALTTHREVTEHPVINDEFPWLAKAARELGDVQVRNRGTVLGNVCWADPRANMAVALLASDAAINVAAFATNGKLEQISIVDFFTGYRSTTLDSRLALSLELTRSPNTVGSYIEFSRQPQDLAICNVCVVHRDSGTAVAVGGIDQQPVRLSQLEPILRDQGLSSKLLRSRIEQTISEARLDPIEDQYGTPAFKQHLAATLIERAIEKCIDGGDHA
jgi:carbon-monoxide dehydrogenase medium subunit